MNNEEKHISYDSVKVLDEGVSIEGVTYPYGSRAEYEKKMAERRERILAAEQVRDALLAEINKCITVNEEYNLYRACSAEHVEYGFFTKDTITDRWLEDWGDKVVITEITPVLVENGEMNVNYIIECKGYYTYDDEKREFSGEIHQAMNYIELKLKDVNEHLVRCVGFSVYRVVAEPDGQYFGSDMELIRVNNEGKVETSETNYME